MTCVRQTTWDLTSQHRAENLGNFRLNFEHKSTWPAAVLAHESGIYAVVRRVRLCAGEDLVDRLNGEDPVDVECHSSRAVVTGGRLQCP